MGRGSRTTSGQEPLARETGPSEEETERLYRVVKALTTPLYRGLLRVRVEGRNHVPLEGGVIVAANHISFFDSVALLQSIPRRAFFIGKAEYMDSWTTRRLFPAMGLIPIEREQARKAMVALEVAANVLRRGDALGIYPEGTRSRDGLLHKGHTGVAQLAIMSGAPIVPVGLVGTEHIQPIGTRVPRPFRRAVVRFGSPLDPAAYGGSPRRRRQLLTDDLMEAIRRLSGQGVSHEFSDAAPPLVRGGNESVYQVHTVGGVGATWAQAARFAVGGVCSDFADGRVATVRRLGCRVMPDGVVRFATEVEVSMKFQPVPIQEAATP
ncbi:MAG: lysophospholipid acyltransferase family protein [Ilumatobacteraceae bacterium]